MAVIWSEIPEELVCMFAERLVCIDDLIRFGGVCKLWRSVSIFQKQKKKAYSPLLMLANAENDNLPSDGGEGVRSFVIPYYGNGGGGANPNKICRRFDIELPKAQGRRCWGSPYGWVVTIGLDFNIALLNPLTSEQLHLSPQTILRDKSIFGKRFSSFDPELTISCFTRKFALGWHQSSQSWLVMAIFGAGEEVALTFTGIGNKAFSSFSSWTCIDYTIDAKDVILFRDQIFLIAHGGKLKVCDIKEGTPPKAIHIAPPPEHLDDSNTFYLVEIGGNLHFVARYYDPVEKEDPVGKEVLRRHVTTYFIVWRFNFSETEWYKLNDLGDYALFLGNNTSFAISTITYPDFSRNCIYFTDDRYYKYNGSFCDMGIYDYKEKTAKPFDIANMGAVFKFSRPTFFMPAL